MDRKYRQRGYMDSDRKTESHRPPAQQQKPMTPEERAQMRGLRHAVQREANEVMRCPDCGRSIAQFGAVVPESTCPHCSAALHTCRACRHFDSGARWECKAPILERVMEKGKANHCPQYEARMVLDATGKRTGSSQGPGSDPKSMFDSLFKR